MVVYNSRSCLFGILPEENSKTGKERAFVLSLLCALWTTTNSSSSPLRFVKKKKKTFGSHSGAFLFQERKSSSLSGLTAKNKRKKESPLKKKTQKSTVRLFKFVPGGGCRVSSSLGQSAFPGCDRRQRCHPDGPRDSHRNAPLMAVSVVGGNPSSFYFFSLNFSGSWEKVQEEKSDFVFLIRRIRSPWIRSLHS